MSKDQEEKVVEALAPNGNVIEVEQTDEQKLADKVEELETNTETPDSEIPEDNTPPAPTDEEITFEVLNAIGYGDPLKEKFAELGIPEAWKQGKRKADIINGALELLAKIKEKQAQGEQDAEQAKLIIEKEEIQAGEQAVIEEKKEVQKLASDKEAKIQAIVDGKSTKESLIAIMDNITVNLKGGNPHFKQDLLERSVIYNEALKRKFNYDYYEK
jgi:hypothetical protein